MTNTTQTSSAWQHAFRVGIAPHLGTAGLMALRDALERDDPRLIQGKTLEPAIEDRGGDWAPEGACAVAFACWHDLEGEPTAEEVEQRFAEVVTAANEEMGEPLGCSWFVSWFDEVPRSEMRQELLAEVEAVLTERGVLQERLVA